MKKLINDPADVVADALAGIAAAHLELRVDEKNKLVVRGDAPVVGKVGLVSGGGTVVLEKIAGAAAEQDRPLAAVAEVARTVNANSRSMGMALTSCTVPAAGKPTFALGEDEMEIGVGIHGEPGRHRVPLAPARE